MATKTFLLILTAALLYAITPVHSQTEPNLPDGPGKEQVVAYCSGCHGLSRVASSSYSQAYWHTAIRMMLNFGVPIPPDQINLVTDYLAKNFPEKSKPVANIIPGPARI
ncbi:MAG TPA: cytochrome c, partial [Candidatus Polarisedimenticolaceae bacterium]|nr:cytochrome c [Candidatus Polarisedimenticolaceae bacterium]